MDAAGKKGREGEGKIDIYRRPASSGTRPLHMPGISTTHQAEKRKHRCSHAQGNVRSTSSKTSPKMLKELSLKCSLGLHGSASRALMRNVKGTSPEGSNSGEMTGSETITGILLELTLERSKSSHWNAPRAVTGMPLEQSLMLQVLSLECCKSCLWNAEEAVTGIDGSHIMYTSRYFI